MSESSNEPKESLAVKVTWIAIPLLLAVLGAFVLM
jgi:hypothetical protein